MLRSLESHRTTDQVVASILSQSTTDINGTAVDIGDYGGVAFVANVGISLDTLSGSLMIELELEHSDDNSTFTDCADTDLSAAVTGTNTGTWARVDAAAEDPAVHVVEYRGSKRYVRPVVLKTGTHTNGIPIGIIAERFDKRTKPVD